MASGASALADVSLPLIFNPFFGAQSCYDLDPFGISWMNPTAHAKVLSDVQRGITSNFHWTANSVATRCWVKTKYLQARGISHFEGVLAHDHVAGVCSQLCGEFAIACDLPDRCRQGRKITNWVEQ